MAKRFIDTDLFKKRFVRGLPGNYKLLWVYLFCECDFAGIWEADLEVAELYCGQHFDLAELRKVLGPKLYFFDGDSKAFIPEFIEFQYGKELNANNPAHRSVIARLEKYNLIKILNDGITNQPVNTREAPTKPLPSPSEGATTKHKIFVKPTLEDVANYCKERGNNVNPESWLDFYTANGWRVGKNPMKDWKAAVRTWENNGITNNRHGRKEGTTTGGLGTIRTSDTSKKGRTSTL